jgi:hypothetical protein
VLGADQSISSVLLDSTSDVTVVNTPKDYGKELVRCGDSESQKVAATVIHYAAIGGALVFHHEKIAQHSGGKLQDAYERLMKKRWIASDLKDVFRKAKAPCQERKS